MDLMEMRRALRRYWLLSTAVFLLTTLIGYVVATRGGESFDSTATISVTPNPALAGSAESVDFYLPVIVERVQSRSFRADLSSQVSDEALEQVDSLSAMNEDDTGIVRITARGQDRDAVAEVANAAAAGIIARYTPLENVPATGSEAASSIVVEVIDEALSAEGSGYSGMGAFMLATAVLGAILAVGAAMLAQRSRRSFDPATRIRNEVGIPVLAFIPTIPELIADGHDLSGLVSSGPAPVVEAFQGLRSRVEVFLREPGSALAVTSWQRNEGRTTITAGLGLMLSAIGRETVVIDTDLRDPHLHERLGEPLAVGLSEVKRFGSEHIISPTTHPNLGLVAAGVATGHPAQTLAIALPAALEKIKAKTPDAVVLIDAPALHAGRHGGHWMQLPAETSTVLRSARRVLLVIDAATSHLPELAGAVERLREDDVIVVGAVLNRRRRGARWRFGPRQDPADDRRAPPPSGRDERVSAGEPLS